MNSTASWLWGRWCLPFAGGSIGGNTYCIHTRLGRAGSTIIVVVIVVVVLGDAAENISIAQSAPVGGEGGGSTYCLDIQIGNDHDRNLSSLRSALSSHRGGDSVGFGSGIGTGIGIGIMEPQLKVVLSSERMQCPDSAKIQRIRRIQRRKRTFTIINHLPCYQLSSREQYSTASFSGRVRD